MRPKTSDSRTQIVAAAIPLFAQHGYSGVSMREIARASGIQAASLYHHFTDKQALYVDAMAQAFEDKAEGFDKALRQTGSAEKRLTDLVRSFTQLMSKDPDFCALLQRELLDGDEARLKQLAEQVFKQAFVSIRELAEELVPGCDSHMVAISIASLILYHLETAPIRPFLPGGKARHNKPEVIARHVTSLLLHGIKGCAK